MKTLYYGGNIVTMEENSSPEAVLIENDVITKIGNFEELKNEAGNNVSLYDLKGQTLMPAFIDAHSHFISTAFSFLQVPLGDAESFEDIKNRISDFIKANDIPEGAWITGKGYDQNLLCENCHPDKSLLDAAAPFNPVVIEHVSGHMGVFSSLALKELSIDENTPCPEGGKIARNENGVTGFMEEAAFITFQKKVPMPCAEDFIKACRKGQKLYASHGITYVQEGFFAKEMIPLYKGFLKSGEMYLNITAYSDIGAGEEVFPLGKEAEKDKAPFKVGGYKIFLDGSPQGKTAWLTKPYEGENFCGYGTMKDEQVTSALLKAMEEEKQLLSHCNGDAAADQLLNCAEKACKIYEEKHGASGKEALKKIRPIIIHAQIIREDQLKKAAELGFTPSFFVYHISHWGEIHLKNLGLQRASKLSPVGTAIKYKLPFTFHQDTPVTPPDMLKSVQCAVLRKTEKGRTLGEDEKITVYDALKGVTVNAARQYFEETVRGSIVKNKKADFVILSENPLETAPENLDKIKIVKTIKNGKEIYTA